EAATVDQYLTELSDDRRSEVETVRNLVLANLPEGYDEVMRWGMITYEVPLETYPDTYNGKPLMFAALASQKQYISLYLMNVAFVRGGEEAFTSKYLATGKKLNMGRSCVRFKRADDLATDVIGESIRTMPLDDFIEQYEASRATR
ncbi:MAG: DUF1801 domain-containing protein, partial [Actinomycetota bacterium]